MPLYWRLSSVPELKELDPSTRRGVWTAAKRRGARADWPHWLLLSWFAPLLCIWTFIPARNTIRRALRNLLDLPPSSTAQPTDPAAYDSHLAALPGPASLALAILASLAFYFLLIRPFRIAAARPHIRQYLTSG